MGIQKVSRRVTQELVRLSWTSCVSNVNCNIELIKIDQSDHECKNPFPGLVSANPWEIASSLVSVVQGGGKRGYPPTLSRTFQTFLCDRYIP